jgi:hypothetical protein
LWVNVGKETLTRPADPCNRHRFGNEQTALPFAFIPKYTTAHPKLTVHRISLFAPGKECIAGWGHHHNPFSRTYKGSSTSTVSVATSRIVATIESNCLWVSVANKLPVMAGVHSELIMDKK